MAGASQAWKLELDAALAKDIDGVREAVIHIAVEALDRVKRRTPILNGQAINNWIVSVGQPSGATVVATLASPGPFAAESAAALASYPTEGWPVIYVQNNVPYAMRLEHGYSKKQPQGMVAITIPELQALMQGLEV